MTTARTRTAVANACVDILDTEFFRALCEPARIQIFRQLVIKGRSDIGTIAEDLPQDRSVIARHLQQMERAGEARPVRDSDRPPQALALAGPSLRRRSAVTGSRGCGHGDPRDRLGPARRDGNGRGCRPPLGSARIALVVLAPHAEIVRPVRRRTAWGTSGTGRAMRVGEPPATVGPMTASVRRLSEI